VIALPEIASWSHGSAHGPVWIACWLILALAYTVAASAPAAARARRIAALVTQAAAMIVMSATAPCVFGTLALVIVAWQAALLFGPAATAAWIAAQTAILSVLVMRGCGADNAAIHIIAMLGFQSFAAVAITIAERERQARIALARVNAELRATRALLEEASRGHERSRIARELHDALGHGLTALGLQLELAKHVVDGPAREQVAEARAMSDRLLDEVRAVVGAMRTGSGTNLEPALRELVSGAFGIAVHLDLRGAFTVDDSARAHCVLRCVQEILTNTLRHAGAKNLWIRIDHGNDGIIIEARDDGRGPEELRVGHGLSGMRERLEELGGWLRVQAAPASALSLSAWLPEANS
jgi:signal transduction histidine kinase